MACPCYLAMTPAEIRRADSLPEHIAYMSCHFSSSDAGLGNLPDLLPDDAILILDDSSPLGDHSPEQILRQLEALFSSHRGSRLLLDFQRPVTEAASRLVARMAEAFPRRIAVSCLYGKAISCPVLLPPVPPDCPVDRYLSPWQEKEVWLEIAPETLELTVYSSGCRRLSAPLPVELPTCLHYDASLFCHYHTQVFPDRICFTLYRTAEDVFRLLKKADSLGVTQAVGLYQELSPWICKNLPA